VKNYLGYATNISQVKLFSLYFTSFINKGKSIPIIYFNRSYIGLIVGRKTDLVIGLFISIIDTICTPSIIKNQTIAL
jgi:hypothetical protein